MAKYFVLDTNVLLDNPEIINTCKSVILSHILRELEKHKLSHNNELAFKARRATRYLESNSDIVKFDLKDYNVTFDENFSNDYVDNKIIQSCIENKYGLITFDLLLKFKARGYDIEVVDIENNDSKIYKGYKEVTLTDEELASFYENQSDNPFELLMNEYLIIKNNNGDIIQTSKWNGQRYINISGKGFTTTAFGECKPYDAYQQCALDSLFNNQMTLIKGKPGSGKSLLSLSAAISMIEKNKYNKLIIFVNPLNTRGAAKLGFYPGSRNEKLLENSIGSMLESKFGSKIEVESRILSGKLVILPVGDIRGFDTTGMKAVVYVAESQNMSVDLMRTAIQRVGNDCKLIIDGDFEAQVDSAEFEGSNNGMRRVSEVFKGEDIYGEVELPIIYRSELAAIADRM